VGKVLYSGQCFEPFFRLDGETIVDKSLLIQEFLSDDEDLVLLLR